MNEITTFEPSWETLKSTCYFPPGVETELDALRYAEDHGVWEMVGVHGGSEPIHVHHVHRSYNSGRKPEVAQIHVGIESWYQGERFIGNGRKGDLKRGEQLMACFVEEPDPMYYEHIVASSLNWFFRQLDRRDIPYLILDFHNTPPSSDRRSVHDTGERDELYFRTSDILPADGFIAAQMLKYNRGVVVNGTRSPWDHNISEVIGNYVMFEHGYIDPRRYSSYFDTLDERLNEIGDLGIDGLQAEFRRQKAEHNRFRGSPAPFPRMGMFKEFLDEVLLTDPMTGEPNWRVIDVLDELEALGDVPEGEVLNLSHASRKALDLEQEGIYTSGGWYGDTYNNFSDVIPNHVLLRDDEKVRRFLLGLIYRQLVSAPETNLDVNAPDEREKILFDLNSTAELLHKLVR